MGACGPFAEQVCEDIEMCPGYTCDKEGMEAACNIVAFFVVYIGAFGWAACVLGIVASSLGCCVCCGCCKANMNDGPKPAAGPTVVVGAVQQAGL